MTCPRCYTELEVASGACPECGIQLLRNVSGMIRTSAVMISSEGENGFYRSVSDVPEPLRGQLLRVTSSENSGTIVIADKAGKEQLTWIVARREAAHAQPPKAAVCDAPTARPVAPRGFTMPNLPWALWAGIILLLSAVGVIAAVFTLRW